jgi:hypothetical protein
MEFSLKHYDNIKKINNINEIRKYLNDNFNDFYENIYSKYDSSVKYSYIDKSMFNLFTTFFKNFKLPNDFDWKKYDAFNNSIRIYTEKGRVLKKYPFMFLTKFPLKALEILNDCKDDDEYCVMNIGLFFSDYDFVEYVCDNKDEKKFKIINTKDELKTVDDSAQYLYCILPSTELCLFSGHHSAGACGQPVICAGYLTVKNHKITQIDNSSGHYMPPSHMFQKGINILFEKNIIDKNPVVDNDNKNVIKIVHFGGRRNTKKTEKARKSIKAKKSRKDKSKKNRKTNRRH